MGPKVYAVPLERPAQGMHPGKKCAACAIQSDSVLVCVLTRDEVGPEVVIKMQIQQSAVQIQEYRVNLRPVNHGHSMCNACYKGKGRQNTQDN